ncbi:MAG: ribosome-binding factor A [Comamonadaceae bacterium]|nr:ribosome-binding factor A [Comamonadaceae bacterium]
MMQHSAHPPRRASRFSRELAELIRARAASDPRVGVGDASPASRSAAIWPTPRCSSPLLGATGAPSDLQRGRLQPRRAASCARELGQRMRMRIVPKLQFRLRRIGRARRATVAR